LATSGQTPIITPSVTQEPPSIGWHLRWRSLRSPPEREWILKGNWTKPYKAKVPRLRELLINSWDCDTRSLDFLKCFPALRQLRVLSYDVEDVSGLYHLPQLRVLGIDRVLRKYLRLDLSRFKQLRWLSARWSHHLGHLNTLKQLKYLQLHHIYGVKHLDFSFHPELRSLHLGPAQGVRSVSLEGLKHLRELTLAIMPRLTAVSGKHFYDTVTRLDIRGSHSIPRKILASFTNLKRVRIGMSSNLTSSAFPRCKPAITRCPV
jgi:hypothetical protein